MKIFLYDGAVSYDEDFVTGVYELENIQTKELEKFVWENIIRNLPKDEIDSLKFEVKDEYGGNKMKYIIEEGILCERNIRLNKDFLKLIRKWKLVCECDSYIF